MLRHEFMTPVAFYMLRERVRPSAEEASWYLMEYLALCEGAEPSGGHLVSHISSLTRPTKDLSKDFRGFIMNSGGQKYQDKPREYKWRFFEAQTGNPPEPTCLALVFALQEANAIPAPPKSSVQAFLDRGASWEALGRWGDALLCYLIGQELYPEDLDLKLRAGIAKLKRSQLAPWAYRALLDVAEERPCSSEAALALAECYVLCADNPRAEIRGSSRQELRDWALMHLERSAAMRPDDGSVRARRDTLRRRLGADPALDFFSTD